MFKEERAKSYKGIAACAVIFILGYILLEWVSIKEDPILGNTFHIVAGYLLMSVALLGIGLIARRLYRLRRKEKRRKSGSPVIFLNDKKARRMPQQPSDQ